MADLGEARGKQELFTRQTPQWFKALLEHAPIQAYDHYLARELLRSVGEE